MKLKSIFTIAVTASTFVFISGCSSPLVYDSIWQEKPVTIDGKATEWKIPLDYYDDKTKLNFSVSNDGVNLYFCVRATEDVTQKGIVNNGLQIWIDTAGGKKKNMGIQFPILQKKDAQATSAKDAQPDESRAAAYGMHKRYSTAIKQMKITGFTGGINGLAELPNMYGINAYLNWDTNNIMIYEACIPLKTLFVHPDTAKVLGVSFGITVTSKNAGSDIEGSSRHGNNGGGGGMGGMRSGGPPGGGKHNAFTNQSMSAYIKFRLATKHN